MRKEGSRRGWEMEVVQEEGGGRWLRKKRKDGNRRGWEMEQDDGGGRW